MLTEKHPRNLVAGRTLVVGLDAACWTYVNPLLEAGRLPALQRLMSEGTFGTLHSTLPALTPTAWASIITGKNPGKHGVFDMLWRRPGAYDFQPTSGAVRVGTPFWKRLNERGIRVGLVNVPFTYPPEEIDGFVVCGFGAPESAVDIAAPGGARTWIEAHFNNYSSRGRLRDLRKRMSLEELLAGEKEHQSMQAKIATGLAGQYDVDVLVINLMLLDHVNHYAQQQEQIEDAICDTDRDLAHLIEAFRPANVLLFSDHGSRRVQGDFLLHQWLLDNEYQSLTKRSPAEQSAALHTVLVRWSSKQNWPPGLLEKSGRRLLQGGLNFLPGLFTDNLWRNVETALPFARQYVEKGEELDYRRTRLFPGSTYSGNLYINLTGREPDGVVRPELRAALQAELIQKLARITIPEEGLPLFSGIHTSDQLYHGPAAAYAPDLILDGYDSPWNAKMVSPGLISSTLKEHYFIEQHGDAGWHSKEGIFVFSGPTFRPGPAAEALPAAKAWGVMDLPATLLYLYDVPIPEDFDGAVMAGAFTGDFLERRPVTFQPGDPETAVPFETAYSQDESAEVLEHLRALGYVD